MSSQATERKEQKRERLIEDTTAPIEPTISREPIVSEDPVIETKETKSTFLSRSIKIKVKELQDSVEKYKHESTELVVAEIIRLAKARYKDGIAQILKQGFSIDLHYGYDTAISILGKQGDTATIKWLIENCRPGLNQAVRAAAAAGDIELIAELYNKGANLNYALFGAAEAGKYELVKDLLKKYRLDINFAARGLAKAGDIEKLREYLDQGANIENVLMFASLGGEIEFVKKILALEIVLNDRQKEHGLKRELLNAAVYGAALAGREEFIIELIEEGADIWQAIKASAAAGRIGLLKGLLTQEAKYNRALYEFAKTATHAEILNYIRNEDNWHWAVKGATASNKIEIGNKLIGRDLRQSGGNLLFWRDTEAKQESQITSPNGIPIDSSYYTNVVEEAAATNDEKLLFTLLGEHPEHPSIQAAINGAVRGNHPALLQTLFEKFQNLLDMGKVLSKVAQLAAEYGHETLIQGVLDSGRNSLDILYGLTLGCEFDLIDRYSKILFQEEQELSSLHQYYDSFAYAAAGAALGGNYSKHSIPFYLFFSPGLRVVVAAEGGHIETISAAMTHRDIEESDLEYALGKAAQFFHQDILKLIRSVIDTQSAQDAEAEGAVQSGNRELILDCIARGADLNKASKMAVLNGHAGLVGNLISEGASISPVITGGKSFFEQEQFLATVLLSVRKTGERELLAASVHQLFKKPALETSALLARVNKISSVAPFINLDGHLKTLLVSAEFQGLLTSGFDVTRAGGSFPIPDLVHIIAQYCISISADDFAQSRLALLFDYSREKLVEDLQEYRFAQPLSAAVHQQISDLIKRYSEIGNLAEMTKALEEDITKFPALNILQKHHQIVKNEIVAPSQSTKSEFKALGKIEFKR